MSEMIVRRMEKVITTVIPAHKVGRKTVPAQTIKKVLYSYDGLTWSSDFKEVKHRHQSTHNLIGKKRFDFNGKRITHDQKVIEQFRTANHKPAKSSMSKKNPVILPVAHHGATFLGKSKGKRHTQKIGYRVGQGGKIVASGIGPKNLKRQNSKRDRDISFNPPHSHFCPHHEANFTCKCDNPNSGPRKCGGDVCIYATTAEYFATLNLTTQNS